VGAGVAEGVDGAVHVGDGDVGVLHVEGHQLAGRDVGGLGYGHEFKRHVAPSLELDRDGAAASPVPATVLAAVRRPLRIPAMAGVAILPAGGPLR
jgi:hypothetical protein